MANDEPTISSIKWTHWLVRGTVVALVILLPLVASWIYSSVTALPRTIRVATGPEEGRYRMIMQSLKDVIEEEFDVEVELVQTEGSFENLERLHDGDVDLALFQAGSDLEDPLRQIDENRKSVSFVANVYPEVTQILVANRLKSWTAESIDIERVAIGHPRSADSAIGQILIDHLGIARNGTPRHLAYTELPEAFATGEIDMAIVQLGIHAPAIGQLLATGHCHLVSVPNRAAFLARHVAFSPFTMPQGIYVSDQTALPPEDVETVSVSAQLLCRNRLHSELVREIAEVIHRPDFAKRNELQKIFVEGKSYSSSKAEFPMHRGARRFYEPSLQPWINTEFVEATEGIRSFIVSMLIAGFFAIRWLLKWRTRSVEHRLDRYIRRLLEIEQQQMVLDFETEPESIQKLENLLDEVTVLRRRALTEFTAHQLNDDPAIPCFLDMSHALSEKISSKLTRGRIGSAIRDR